MSRVERYVKWCVKNNIQLNIDFQSIKQLITDGSAQLQRDTTPDKEIKLRNYSSFTNMLQNQFMNYMTNFDGHPLTVDNLRWSECVTTLQSLCDQFQHHQHIGNLCAPIIDRLYELFK